MADVRDTAALQSDWISSIFEDSRKRMWICNDNGNAYLLNKKTGKFYNYNLHATHNNKIKSVWNIIEDKNNVVWITGSDGYYRLNETSNRFERYDAVLGLDKDIRTGLLTVDSQNNFWISTSTGVKFYNQQQKKLYSKEYNPRHNPVFDITDGIGKIIPDGNLLWITSSGTLWQYDFITNKLIRFSFSSLLSKEPGLKTATGKIGGGFLLRDGTLIILLPERGLAVYQRITHDFLIITADNSNPSSYHINENIESNAFILQDRENNILIGTNAGINIYNPGKQFFQTHWPGTEKKHRFPKEPVNDFLELPDGNILIGYYGVNGGIVKMDNAFNFKKQYLLKDGQNKNSASNQVWNLYKDENGIVWAPDQKNTIVTLNPVTDKLTEVNDPEMPGPVTVINRDSAGDTWLGFWRNGLGKISAVSKTKSFYTQFLYSDSTNIKRVQCMLQDADKIWVGTLQNGLQVFDKNKEHFTAAFTANEKNNRSISSNCVTYIIRLSKDTLVIATLMGINIFDKKNKTFKTITAKEGLPNNLVQSIIKDDFGNVWAACFDDGFCKINMHDLSVTRYGIMDGITDNALTSRFYKLKNGTFLIGASGSFISFNPSLFKTLSAPGNVRITAVSIYDKEVTVDSQLLNNLPLALSYNENALRIAFTALEFWSPSSIKYYYKLAGADKDWIPADASHTAVYNQLKDGNYTFYVKCANKDGISSITTTQLKICIAPPFWKTWWFIVLVSLLVFSLIYLLIKWREKNINSIAAEKLKVQQLNAAQYKRKLELEQIINYFSSSLIDKNTVDDVLWDVAKNLIGQLGFVDCMIYLWNADKTRMIQKAGFGPKDSVEEISKQLFDVRPGQGVVGHVIQSREAIMIADTSIDNRYRSDDIVRLSEITVPVMYNNELLGVIDSEHPEKNFFTAQHLQVLNTIAALVANKINAIEAEHSLQQTKLEMYSMNEQLSKAKLEALRSQMNPHFIFNSLNAIQECILTNKVEAAYEYLSKFSKLQRMVLNNSEKELIPLSGEIEMLQLYLSLESLRFSKSFTWSMDTASITDAEEIMIPSLITQPIVENAVWHGLRNKEGDKKISITYEETNNCIYITIDDNGIGRAKAGIIKQQKLGSNQYVSKGTMMLQQRLHVLSQQFNVAICIETIDKTDEQGKATGTKVILSFPSNLELVAG